MVSPQRVAKTDLKEKLEHYLYENLSDDEYEVFTIDAHRLLTWNRSIIAYNLIYLRLIGKNLAFAERIYTEMIRATSKGTFCESEHEADKKGMHDFFSKFHKTSTSIKQNGFNAQTSIIPLAEDGSILNGTHRVACAIFYNTQVTCVKTNLPAIRDDYKNLFERAMPASYIEEATLEFCKYSQNTYVAFLWPSQKELAQKVELLFDNVVYKKDIKLTPTGATNLLIELYKHMENWIGTIHNDFIGVKKKLVECFPEFIAFKVIIFQSESLEKVRELKRTIRDLCKIGYSSIHITDTHEETHRISKLLLNQNGLHFLNYSHPYKFLDNYHHLINLEKRLRDNKIDREGLIIDGGSVLAIYGIRKSVDIDILVDKSQACLLSFLDIDIHDSELKYHELSKEQLIWNPQYYFEYMGLKFISFDQLYHMKTNRDETKDINDCQIMEAYIASDTLKEAVGRLKQYFFYYRIIARERIIMTIVVILKNLKIYEQFKYIYRKVVRGKND